VFRMHHVRLPLLLRPTRHTFLDPSLSCILFILIRWVPRPLAIMLFSLMCPWCASYLSVALVAPGGFVAFGTFTLESCQRWYIVHPVFKGRCRIFAMQ
jgi:hypothetical protein